MDTSQYIAVALWEESTAGIVALPAEEVLEVSVEGAPDVAVLDEAEEAEKERRSACTIPVIAWDRRRRQRLLQWDQDVSRVQAVMLGSNGGHVLWYEPVPLTRLVRRGSALEPIRQECLLATRARAPRIHWQSELLAHLEEWTGEADLVLPVPGLVVRAVGSGSITLTALTYAGGTGGTATGTGTVDLLLPPSAWTLRVTAASRPVLQPVAYSYVEPPDPLAPQVGGYGLSEYGLGIFGL